MEGFMKARAGMPENPMQRDVVLRGDGLWRQYRVGHEMVSALSGVDIKIRRGEFVAIMGPSGSGKSTLLNLIGGLDQPTAGRVQIEGQDLALLNEEQLASLRREKTGFIFQRFDLLPVLTARENVEFPLLLAGIASQERRERADELLELVQLTAKADHLPDELSGGQQQRIGIARALANSSSILLADEPTGNLDSTTAEEVMDVLITLSRARNLTLIMVTHDPEVAAHAERILQLKDGRLVTEDGQLQ